jgi:hypothetical protein
MKAESPNPRAFAPWVAPIVDRRKKLAMRWIIIAAAVPAAALPLISRMC